MGGAIAVFFVRLLLLLLFFSKKVFQIRIIGGLLDPDPDPLGQMWIRIQEVISSEKRRKKGKEKKEKRKKKTVNILK